jgi:hypothetical protein
MIVKSPPPETFRTGTQVGEFAGFDTDAVHGNLVAVV